MSTNIYTGGFIGPTPTQSSGIWGIGPTGMTYAFLTEDYRQTVINDGATGLWLLNETSGSTANDEIGSYDLTYLNTPTFNASGIGLNVPQSVEFNGTDENAKGDNSATYTSTSAGNWSLECWIRFTTTSTSRTPLMVRDTAGTAQTVTGAIIVNNVTVGVISAQAVSSSVTIIQLNSSGGFNDGAWHHVVATSASGGAFKLYVDGVEQASSTTTRNSTSSQRSVTVASNRSGVSSYIQYFPGSIAACAVYLSTLSLGQIENHYQIGKV